MLRAPLYLLATRATPPPSPGLHLAALDGWAFGRLVVDEPDASPAAHERWARAVVVHAYADGPPQVASRALVGPRALLADPLPGRPAGPLALPFAVDLRAHLDLVGGAWFVRATAEEHTSGAARADLSLAGDAPLSALAVDPTPAEALLLARIDLAAGRLEAAAARFAAALTDEGVAAALDAGALHDAACAAARLAAEAPEAAARHAAGARALTLLRDAGQRTQRALAARLQRHLLEALDGDGHGDGGLEPLVAQEVEHLRWVRDGDPDLAHLRATSAFAALFRPERRGRATGALRRPV